MAGKSLGRLIVSWNDKYEKDKTDFNEEIKELEHRICIKSHKQRKMRTRKTLIHLFNKDKIKNEYDNLNETLKAKLNYRSADEQNSPSFSHSKDGSNRSLNSINSLKKKGGFAEVAMRSKPIKKNTLIYNTLNALTGVRNPYRKPTFSQSQNDMNNNMNEAKWDCSKNAVDYEKKFLKVTKYLAKCKEHLSNIIIQILIMSLDENMLRIHYNSMHHTFEHFHHHDYNLKDSEKETIQEKVKDPHNFVFWDKKNLKIISEIMFGFLLEKHI